MIYLYGNSACEACQKIQKDKYEFLQAEIKQLKLEISIWDKYFGDYTFGEKNKRAKDIVREVLEIADGKNKGPAYAADHIDEALNGQIEEKKGEIK